MKMVVLAGSILALAGAASAADLPMKAAYAPPPPILSWAGFYIGGHGGYGWKDDPFSLTISSNPRTILNGFRSTGWVAGGQFGYNWQYGGFVGGVELDVSATDIKGNSAFVTTDFGGGNLFSRQLGDDVRLLGSARGRFGWAPSSDWLLYGTGGLGWERLNQTSFSGQIIPGTGFFNVNSTTPTSLFGWVLGAGVEYRLWQTNWIGRLEYLHYDFGQFRNSTFIVTNIQGEFGQSSPAGDQKIDVVRVGLSYKFGN
jgi:opacity protein-like surface antigen